MPTFLRALSPWVFLVLAAAPVSGQKLPPLTAAERELHEVPGYPNAPAVVLLSRAEFQMMEPTLEDRNASFKVWTRIKILHEEGKELGKVVVRHRKSAPLKNFQGQTVLPDGKVVPLAKDSVFVRESSKSRKLYVTTAVFPAVDVGAILEYSYDLKVNSNQLPPPWWFQQSIPTLSSEIIYHVPQTIGFRRWLRDPLGTGIRQETTATVIGHDVRAWGENLPPLPDEPFSFPESDIVARFMIVPTEMHFLGDNYPLYDTWLTTTEDIERLAYREASRKLGAVRRRTKEVLASSGAKGAEAQALEIYRFVRDEIATEELEGVGLRKDSTLEGVLSNGSGDYAEKALLLRAMLGVAKIDSQLVWAAGRSAGLVDLKVPDPRWFDRVIVRVVVDGQLRYLDPCSRALAFGRLDPDYEGTTGVVLTSKKPEGVQLPEDSFDENLRQAQLELTIDPEGRVQGTGSLVLQGHHAWEWLESRGRSEDDPETWENWLQDRFPDYSLSDIEAEDSVDDRLVKVRWKMAQRPEEVLEDEVSLEPVRPLGPVAQPFILPAEKRRTPVWFGFGDRNTVEMSLTWPEGWELDVRPQLRSYAGDAGSLTTSLEVDESERSLTYKRQLDVKKSTYVSRPGLRDLRDLFDTVEKNDAQTLVVLRN